MLTLDGVMVEVMEMSTPEHFKALAHPMRHRLLFALSEQPATLSQLAETLGSHKGNVAHHLKVLVAAGLAVPAGTRRVRGGTEQYYQRTARRLSYGGPEASGATTAAFQAIGAEVAQADADAFTVLRTIRLSAAEAAHVTAVLRDLSEMDEVADQDQPRYRMVLGLYRPGGPERSPADGEAPESFGRAHGDQS